VGEPCLRYHVIQGLTIIPLRDMKTRMRWQKGHSVHVHDSRANGLWNTAAAPSVWPARSRRGGRPATPRATV